MRPGRGSRRIVDGSDPEPTKGAAMRSTPGHEDRASVVTHDLVQLAGIEDLLDAEPVRRPGWLPEVWSGWAVVRRARFDGAAVPVGVRGATRAQRWAGRVSPDAIRRAVRPEEIVPDRPRPLPAFDALSAVAGVATAMWPGSWGPGGSTAYELVTGRAVVTGHSDLDLVVRRPPELSRPAAHDVLHRLRAAAGPVRVDVLLETGTGAVSLQEWALTGEGQPVALRTPDGPVLTRSPWGHIPDGGR